MNMIKDLHKTKTDGDLVYLRLGQKKKCVYGHTMKKIRVGWSEIIFFFFFYFL